MALPSLSPSQGAKTQCSISGLEEEEEGEEKEKDEEEDEDSKTDPKRKHIFAERNKIQKKKEKTNE